METKGTVLGLLAAALVSSLPGTALAGSVAGKVNAKSAKHKRNVVVFVEKAPWTGTPKNVQMDQRNQVFLPFVVPVVRGGSVDFLNNDATGHNVFTPDGEKFDLGVFNKDEVRAVQFKNEGVYTILCKMHPSMIGYVVVLPNPYFAVTAEDGSYKIEGLPPGEYTLKVWSERKKAEPVKVTVAEGAPASADLELK